MTIPRINLLPAGHRPAAAGRWGYAAGVGVMVLVGVAYYGFLAREQRSLATRLPALRQAQAQVQAGLNRARQLKDREERAARVEAAMQGLRGRTWWPLLLEFQELTPTGLSWEAVEGSGDRIRLRGRAAGMVEVAQFVTGLAGSPRVEGVELHEARRNDKGRFEVDLTVRLLPGEGKP